MTDDVEGWADPVWARNTQQMLERFLGMSLKRPYAAYIGHQGEPADVSSARQVALKNDVVEALAPDVLTRSQAERLFDHVRRNQNRSVYEIVSAFKDRAILIQEVLQGDP